MYWIDFVQEHHYCIAWVTWYQTNNSVFDDEKYKSRNVKRICYEIFIWLVTDIANDLIIIIGVYSLEMSYNQLPCDGQR